jgi:large subunit ribosomal protein L15
MSSFILTVPKGARKNKKRLGRGGASGTGCTAGKGSKGQNARAGGGVRPGFEGGQMPLYRRIARRGFSNCPFKKEYLILNIDDLDVFKSGDTVSRESLLELGLIGKRKQLIKLLGRGELKKKLVVEVDKVSKHAREKITGAGGEVKEFEPPKPKKKKGGIKKAAAPVKEKPAKTAPEVKAAPVQEKPAKAAPEAKAAPVKEKPAKAAPKAKAETVAQKPADASPKTVIRTPEEKPGKAAPKAKAAPVKEKPAKAAPEAKAETVAETTDKTVFREKTETVAEESAEATPKTVIREPAEKSSATDKKKEDAAETGDSKETKSKDKE